MELALARIRENPRVRLIAPLGYGLNINLVNYLIGTGLRVLLAVPLRDLALSLRNYLQAALPEKRNSIHIYPDELSAGTGTLSLITYRDLYYRMLDTIIDGKPNGVTFCDVMIVQDVQYNLSENIELSIILNLWKFSLLNGQDISIPRLIELSPISLNNSEGREQISEATLPTSISNDSIIVIYADSEVIPHPQGMKFQKILINRILEVANSRDEGDILVFHWDDEMITELVNRLTGLDSKHQYFDAGSEMDTGTLRSIHQVVEPQASRRIIITTHEMSHIIISRDIKIIIDTCFEVKKTITPSGWMYPTVRRVSKQIAQIRASRVGSLRCYRMISKKDYDELSPSLVGLTGLEAGKNSSENVLSIPTTIYLAEIISRKLLPLQVFPEGNDTQLSAELQQLTDLRLMTGSEVTLFSSLTTGETILFRKLPHSLRMKLLIRNWLREISGTTLEVYPIIVIASLIDCYENGYFSYFSPRAEDRPAEGRPERTTGKERDQHMRAYFSRFRGYSDIESLYNIWNAYLTESGSADRTNPKAWAERNSLNVHKIIRVIMLINTSVEILSEAGWTVNVQPVEIPPVLVKLRTVMLPLFQNDIFQLYKEDTQYYYLPYSGKRITTSADSRKYRIDRYGIVNGYYGNYPPFLLGILHNSLSTKTGETLHLLQLTLDLPATAIRPRG